MVTSPMPTTRSPPIPPIPPMRTTGRLTTSLPVMAATAAIAAAAMAATTTPATMAATTTATTAVVAITMAAADITTIHIRLRSVSATDRMGRHCRVLPQKAVPATPQQATATQQPVQVTQQPVQVTQQQEAPATQHLDLVNQAQDPTAQQKMMEPPPQHRATSAPVPRDISPLHQTHVAAANN